MKRSDYISWEAYFMSEAILASYRSKDPKTQNGACIVNKLNHIIGTGYNGLTKGLDDNNPKYWGDDNDLNISQSKHSYVAHAERNAIDNSNKNELINSTMYATLFPCIKKGCAHAIAQKEISKLVYLRLKPHHREDNYVAMEILNAAGVEVIPFHSLDIPDEDKLQVEIFKKINNGDIRKKLVDSLGIEIPNEDSYLLPK